MAGAPAGSLPRLSIVTPSLNQGRFLEETIRSVLLQGYPDLEYIIMDGGSTDESVEVIRKYEPWLAHWSSGADGGQSCAINKGFERASGEVFGWLNSDDVYAPGALARLAELRAASPDSPAWVGATAMVDAQGDASRTILPRPGGPDEMGDWWVSSRFMQPGCLFSADAFREAGGLDERLHVCMDVDLWIRLVQRGEFATTDDVVAHAREHADAKTFRNQGLMQCEFIAANCNRGFPEIAERRLDRLLKRQTGMTLDTLTPGEVLRHLTVADILNTVPLGLVLRYVAARVRRAVVGGDRSRAAQ